MLPAAMISPQPPINQINTAIPFAPLYPPTVPSYAMSDESLKEYARKQMWVEKRKVEIILEGQYTTDSSEFQYAIVVYEIQFPRRTNQCYCKEVQVYDTDYYACV